MRYKFLTRLIFTVIGFVFASSNSICLAQVVLMESDRLLEHNYTWRGAAPRNDREVFQEASKHLLRSLNSEANISSFEQMTGENITSTLSNKYEDMGSLISNTTTFTNNSNKTEAFKANKRGLIVSIETLGFKEDTYYNEYKRDQWTGVRNSKAGGTLLYNFVVYAPIGYTPISSEGNMNRDDSTPSKPNTPDIIAGESRLDGNYIIRSTYGCPNHEWCNAELSWDSGSQHPMASVEFNDRVEWEIIPLAK